MKRLRVEADLALALLDARVDEDADQRAEEAVARARPPLPGGRTSQRRTSSTAPPIAGSRSPRNQHEVAAARRATAGLGDREPPSSGRVARSPRRRSRPARELGAQTAQDAHAEPLVPDVVDDLGALHRQRQRLRVARRAAAPPGSARASKSPTSAARRSAAERSCRPTLISSCPFLTTTPADAGRPLVGAAAAGRRRRRDQRHERTKPSAGEAAHASEGMRPSALATRA